MRTYILKSLLPWLIFFAFADGTVAGLLYGAVGGLVCLLIFDFYPLKKFFVLDWSGLLFFTCMIVVSFVFPKSMLIYYSLLLATVLLTVVSLITVIVKKPWALAYAKIQTPRSYWHHPVFISVNSWVTVVWGVVFLVYAVLLVLFNVGIGAKLWMLQILPTAALVFAMGFMLIFPDFYREKTLKQGGVAAIDGISKVHIAKLGPNVEMGYRLLGKGPLLVLAHGAQTNMHSWDPFFLQRLSEHFQVLIFDYPGVGYSVCQNLPFTAETIANCVHGILDKLKLRASAIVGYSMGGLIAQKYAVDYADEVTALILISTTCGGDEAVWCDGSVKQKLKKVALGEEMSGEKRFHEMMAMMFSKEVFPRVFAKIKTIFTFFN